MLISINVVYLGLGGFRSYLCHNLEHEALLLFKTRGDRTTQSTAISFTYHDNYSFMKNLYNTCFVSPTCILSSCLR